MKKSSIMKKELNEEKLKISAMMEKLDKTFKPRLNEQPIDAENGDDGDDEPYVESPLTHRDGWNEKTLDDVGLIEWMEHVERVQYEILNARRGSYGISGDTPDDLHNDLLNLKRELEYVIGDIEKML